MKIKICLTIIILWLFILIPLHSWAQTPEMITARQRDTILMMTARENSHYDIAMVLDISGSMTGIIEKLKARAMKVVDFAVPGDTLVFIRFDDSPRRPLIQPVEDIRDMEMFKGWIRKTATTQRFGTDIQSAYYIALETLHQLNEARRVRGEPIRIQYVVFVSDGDDIPPAHSEFRNIGSEKSLRLEELIEKARREQILRVIPVGMEFDGYRPEFVRFDPEHMPHGAIISDSEMDQFVEHLKDVLNRKPAVTESSTEQKVPREPYQFYIDWLSGKVTLESIGPSKTDDRNTIQYRYRVKSSYRSLNLKNLSARAQYVNLGGGPEGRIISTDISSSSLGPGENAIITVTIRYPLNWSFRKKTGEGTINLNFSGDMTASVDGDSQRIPTASPTPTPRDEIYAFPFNNLTRSDSIKLIIPVARALYLYAGFGLLALFLFPAFLLYQVAVPISVTLRSGDKARAFNLAHRGRITIGGKADFEIPGADQPVAEIQRRFRRFVLAEKLPDTIARHCNPREGRITLKLGGGFSLNAGGSYHEFEFLPGNQEYSDQNQDTDPSIPDIDFDDDDGDGFQF